MSKNALLFNYQYCSGCHSCEIACRNHLGIGPGKWGIKVTEVEPFRVKDEKRSAMEWIYQPVPTQLCDMCGALAQSGESPACVHHCLAFCIEFGPVEDMFRRASDIGSRVSVFLP